MADNYSGNFFEIDFRGHEEAMRLIETQTVLLSKNIETAIARTVLFGIARIANDCPVDTGRLRASITGSLARRAGVDLDGDPQAIAEGRSQSTTMFNKYQGRIGTSIEYALYQEYGVRGRFEGRAFFRNNLPLIENYFNQQMDGAIQATREGRLLREGGG